MQAELDILTGITLTQEWMVNEIEQRLTKKTDQYLVTRLSEK
jgi:hypothetical protein